MVSSAAALDRRTWPDIVKDRPTGRSNVRAMERSGSVRTATVPATRWRVSTTARA